MQRYDNKGYWEERLGKSFTLGATGHSGFTENYNKYLYSLKARALEKACERYRIVVKGKNILDVGSGTGFFVDHYLRKKAASVCGIDITDASVTGLRRLYPDMEFYRCDIGKPCHEPEKRFDMINAFDVLYHIIDDQAFGQAIRNIGNWCNPGGWILITDTFENIANNELHVKYRPLAVYEKIFKENGVQILGLEQITSRIDRPMLPFLKGRLARKIMGRAQEMLAFFLYLSEIIYCPPTKSGIKLLIGKRLPYA